MSPATKRSLATTQSPPLDPLEIGRNVARIRLTPTISAVAGRLPGQSGDGGSVAFESKTGGLVMRTHKRCRNPQTDNQSWNRALLGSIGRAWSSLTAAQAAAWASLAGQIRKTNPLGLTYKLSGIGVFSAVNMWRAYGGYPVTSDAPTSIEIPLQPVGLLYIGLQLSSGIHIDVDPLSLDTTNEIGFRISPKLPGQARQAIEQRCRFMRPIDYSRTGSVSGGRCLYNSMPVPPGYAYGDRVGVHLTPVGADFLPGKPKLIGNFPVSVDLAGLELNFSFVPATRSGAVGSQTILDMEPDGGDGTCSGPVPSETSLCPNRPSMLFSASQQNIKFARITRPAHAAWSASAWLQCANSSNWNVIFGDYASGSGLWGLQGANLSYFRATSGESISRTLTAPYSGRSMHLAIVSDGSNILTYENGALVGSNGIASTSFAPNCLGTKLVAPGEGYQGLMAEPAFFSNALTAPEIAALYAQGPVYPGRYVV